MIKTINYNLKEDFSINLVLISDIHYSNNKKIKLLNNVLKNIKTLNPSYICITGDLLDDNYIDDQSDLLEWLKKLGTLAPILYITGNHEYYGKDKQYFLNEELMNEIKKINNLIYLDNEIFKTEYINFVGINTPINCYKNNKVSLNKFIDFMNSLNLKLDNKYNIMLCHSPISLIRGYKKINIMKKIDLALCGHLHKGLTPEILKPILKGRGLISPFKNVGFKYSYGKHLIGNTIFIINSGITILSKKSKISALDFIFTKEISNIKIK